MRLSNGVKSSNYPHFQVEKSGQFNDLKRFFAP
jgi:hypothetical protein